MNLLIVNFHYVHPRMSDPYPAVFPTPPDELRAQLVEMGKSFQFVSGADLSRALAKNEKLPERCCLITFDDGLACQFEQALPVLDELKIPAIFFVSCLPLISGKALLVHKNHYVRRQASPGYLLQGLKGFAAEKGIALPPIDAEEIAKARLTYRYDSEDSALLKWLLNFCLNSDQQAAFIDREFQNFYGNERNWARDFYMTEKQIQNLASRRYLGSHCLSHRPLAKLPEADALQEMQSNQEELEKICGPQIDRWVSYPFGGVEAVTKRESLLASQLGIELGFTMERAINRSLAEPLLLARIDTNDAPGGSRPVLKVEADKLRAEAGMSLARSRYLTEKAN